MHFARAFAFLAASLLPCLVRAAVPGGGPTGTDCLLQLDTPAPNHPFSVPDKPKKAKQVRCFDGDAGCDVDGEVNGECRFPLNACFAAGPIGDCTPAEVTAFSVSGASGNADLRALETAGRALLPAAGPACTSDQGVRVRLRRGGKEGATRTVKLKARTAAGTDADSVAFTCLPHGWPSYGYDHRNRRASPVETKLTPETADRLDVRWNFDIGAYEGLQDSVTVTSTPTVANGMVFVTAWNGKVYGLRARDGKVRWSYDTGAGDFGIQSSATLTPEGRLLVGDGNGILHTLVAKTGQLLWTASVGDTDPAASHIWASPVIANGRVFMGRASHSDNPCTRGHLYAFDLETGAELWRYATVPERVCRNDTAVECTTAADCGGAECVPGVGGGVTATVAVDPTGDTVYMGSVGCYTSPSIGNSDALFALDATNGTARWIYRTRSIEQFKEGARAFYQDFGFLNGPLLVDASDGAGGTRPLVVGPSKDGTVYALDPVSGTPVWTRTLVPNPVFAGFGLFNAAAAWANDTLYTSLYETIIPDWPESNDHLYAFAGLDGAPRWSAQIGPAWSPVAIAGGLLFVGTNSTTGSSGASEFYVHDAATGVRLKTIPTPKAVWSGASVADGRVYVGYGGGVLALGLP